MHDADMLAKTHLPKELTTSPDEESQSWTCDFRIPPEGINLDEVVDKFTLGLVKKAIEMANGNISQAAKLLGMPRGTLRYKLEKYEGEISG